MGEDISSMVGYLQGEGVHWSTCLSAGRGWSGCCLCWCMGKGSKQLEQKQQYSSLAIVEEHSQRAQGEEFTWEEKENAKKMERAWCFLGHVGLTWASIQT